MQTFCHVHHLSSPTGLADRPCTIRKAFSLRLSRCGRRSVHYRNVGHVTMKHRKKTNRRMMCLVSVGTEMRTLTVRRHIWELFRSFCRRSMEEQLLACVIWPKKVNHVERQRRKQYEASTDSDGAAPSTKEASHGFGDHGVGFRCRMVLLGWL